jgi:hypothetical protein
MQKHVEIDEPEETHELELDTTLFGMAPPTGALSEEEEPDVEEEDVEDDQEGEVLAEEAVVAEEGLDEAEELAEDMLEVEEDVDLADSNTRDLPGDFDEDL